MLLRFGQAEAVVNGGPLPTAAGLHLKWPFVDQVAMFDRRILALSTAPVVLAGPTPATLQGDLRYRILDPLRFYRSLGDGQVGAQRLSQLLQDGLGRAVSGAGSQASPAALDGALLDDLRARSAGLGVAVLDARVVDAAPPASTVDVVAARMQEVETQQATPATAAGDPRGR